MFILKCLINELISHLRGEFLCTFCRSLENPEIKYCEDSRKTNGEQGLSPEDQRVSMDDRDFLNRGFLCVSWLSDFIFTLS